VARLRRQLFEKIMRLEIGFFDMTRTGELINRLSSDTTILKEAGNHTHSLHTWAFL
jgi:ABC-type multidrug transport system fused ATPase/permease subunit